MTLGSHIDSSGASRDFISIQQQHHCLNLKINDDKRNFYSSVQCLPYETRLFSVQTRRTYLQRNTDYSFSRPQPIWDWDIIDLFIKMHVDKQKVIQQTKTNQSPSISIRFWKLTVTRTLKIAKTFQDLIASKTSPYPYQLILHIQSYEFPISEYWITQVTKQQLHPNLKLVTISYMVPLYPFHFIRIHLFHKSRCLPGLTCPRASCKT